MSSIQYGPISWERMIRAVEKVRERLDRTVAALDSASIPYAVAGDNAVAAWISRVDETAVRNMQYVEIVLRREDFDRAKAILDTAGFRYADGMDVFLDGPNANLRDGIRILFAREKLFDECLAANPNVSEVDLSGSFPIVNLEPLVRMKLAFYQFKDRVDVLDLINVGLVDESWSTRFAGELAARLQGLLNHPDRFRAYT